MASRFDNLVFDEPDTQKKAPVAGRFDNLQFDKPERITGDALPVAAPSVAPVRVAPLKPPRTVAPAEVEEEAQRLAPGIPRAAIEDGTAEPLSLGVREQLLAELVETQFVPRKGPDISSDPSRGLITRNVASGINQAIARVGGVLNRLPGASGDAATLLEKHAQEIAAGSAAAEADLSPAKQFAGETIRGATGSLLQSVGGAVIAGPAGAIGLAVATTANSAYVEGAEAGLEGKKLRNFVIKQGAAEGIPAALMQAVGLGGLEKQLGRLRKAGLGKTAVDAVRRGWVSALGRVGISIAQEIPEELTTEGLQALNEQMSGVDPNALDPEALRERALSTFAQTILQVGVAGSPSLGAGAAQSISDKIAQAQPTPPADDAPVDLITGERVPQPGLDVQEAPQEPTPPDAAPSPPVPEIAAPGQVGRAPEAQEQAVEAEQVQVEAAEEVPVSEVADQPVETEPSEAQQEAGNYQMGHLHRDGFDISIENPAGSVRRGTDEDGKVWETPINHDYGYLRGTVGKDKDHLDVFINPGSDEGGPVFVVNQVNPKTDKFDEHKIMMGFESAEEAQEAYLSNYEEGWQGLGSIVEMDSESFKTWAKDKKQTQKPATPSMQPKVAPAVVTTEEGQQTVEEPAIPPAEPAPPTRPDTTTIPEEIESVTAAEKPTAEVVSGEGKQPWEMTREEYSKTVITRVGKSRSITFDQWLESKGIPRSELAGETETADFIGQRAFPQQRTAAQKGKEESLAKKVRRTEDLEKQYRIEVLEDVATERPLTTSKADAAYVRVLHKRSVIKALSEGQNIPTKVLADYPDLQAKLPEPKKVGDAQRIMGIDAVVAKTERIDGIDYELYNANKLKDERGVVRTFDADSGEVINAGTTFPTFDQAETSYNEAVRRAKGEPAQKARERVIARRQAPPLSTAPETVEPAPAKPKSMKEKAKAKEAAKAKPAKRRRKPAKKPEVNLPLEEWRSKMKSGGIRPPKRSGSISREDLELPPVHPYIRNDGVYSWDTALEEAVTLGLAPSNPDPSNLGRLLKGKVALSTDADIDIIEARAEEEYNNPEIGKPKTVNEAELNPGALIYIKGEIHRVTKDEDGAVIQDGETFRVTHLDEIDDVNAIIQPDDPRYPKTLKKYREQERDLAGEKVKAEPTPESGAISSKGQADLGRFGEAASKPIKDIPGQTILPGAEEVTVSTGAKKKTSRMTPEEVDEAIAADKAEAKATLHTRQVEAVHDAIRASKALPQLRGLLLRLNPGFDMKHAKKDPEKFIRATKDGHVEVKQGGGWALVLSGEAKVFHQEALDAKPTKPKDMKERAALKKAEETEIDSYSYATEPSESEINARRTTLKGLRVGDINLRVAEQTRTVAKKEQVYDDAVKKEDSLREQVRTITREKGDVVPRLLIKKSKSASNVLFIAAADLRDNKAFLIALQERQNRKEKLAALKKKTAEKAAEKAAKEADSAETFDQLYGGLGVVPPPRHVKIRNDEVAFPDELRAPTPESEAAIQAAHGAEVPGIWEKAVDTSIVAWHKATRAQEYLPKVRKFDVARENFRLLREVPQIAADETNRRIGATLSGLGGPAQKTLFERYLFIANLNESIERGEPSGRFTLQPDQVKAYLAILQSSVDKTPAVKKAIETRQAVRNELTDELVENGLLPDDIDGEWYYHQQVLTYLDASRVNRGGGPRVKKKSFQKARTTDKETLSTEFDYNTDYIEAESAWMRDALTSLGQKKFLDNLGAKYDVAPNMKQAEQEQFLRDNPDHEAWQPEPGNFFYQAVTLPEKIVEQIQNGLLGEMNITPDMLREVVALGSSKPKMIMPKEIVEQLESMEKPKPHNLVSKAARDTIRGWKIWTLLNPKRAIGYNIRNLTGDIDPVLGAAPGVIKFVPKATKELAGYHGGTLSLSEDLRNARDLGVIASSMTGIEIPSVQELDVFKRFYSKNKSGLTGAPKKYFDVVRNKTEFRENMLRFAAYKYYLEKLKSGTLVNYGGAKKSAVENIHRDMGVEVAAAHLSRNLLGDYGNLTVMGNWLRETTIPFWSWQEVNAKRYPKLIVSAIQEGKSRGLKAGVRAGAVPTAALSGAIGFAAVMRLASWYAMQNLWNRLMFPDEEDELGTYDRANPHIIIKRNEDGTAMILRNTGAMGDVLEWMGINDLFSLLPQYRNGQISAGDLATEMAKAPLNKMFGSLGPHVKLPFEVAFGVSGFPDAFNPRTAPRDELVAGTFGLSDELKTLKGFLTGSGERARPNYFQRFIGVSDPRRNALSEMYDLRNKYLRQKGQKSEFRGGASPFKVIRDAAIAEDYDAFKDAFKVYLASGKNLKSFTSSLRSLDPIASRLKKSMEREFEQDFLSDIQRKRLRVARDYSQELRVRLHEWRLRFLKEEPAFRSLSGLSSSRSGRSGRSGRTGR